VETLACSVAQPVCDGVKSNAFDASTLADLNDGKTATSAGSAASAKDTDSSAAPASSASSVAALALPLAAFLALR
jgi:hypothetical protein